MSYAHLEYDPLLDAHKCEECGRWYKGLSRHITRHHRISAREYKKKWGLDMKEQLLSAATLRRLSVLAYVTGVNKNLTGEFRFKKGKTKIQEYERSEQTKRRLRMLKRFARIKKL